MTTINDLTRAQKLVTTISYDGEHTRESTSSHTSDQTAPISPSDNTTTSSPSLEDDSDTDDALDSGEEGEPSLQMMGETHMRLKKLQSSQSQLGLAIPTTTRPRMVSDPMARLREGEISIPPSHAPTPHPPQPAQSLPVDIPWSPAMAFLAGLNSPSMAPRSLSPSTSTIEVASPQPIVSAPPADERIGPYILGPVIAHGGFSIIRKGTSPSGVVAVKIIQKTKPSRQQQELSAEDFAALENEISIWSALHHEYILPLFSTYRTDDAIYLISLYCPAGSLFDILRLHGAPGLPQDDVGTMFRQIVRGLKYLHEQMFLIHGDIKLENILVDELGACRITDFGLSQYINQSEQTDEEGDELLRPASALPPHLRGRAPRHRNSTHVPGVNTPLSLHNFPAGSLPYAAPELLLPPTSREPSKSRTSLAPHHKSQPEHRYKPHPAQDIWALGCLLHALLFGRLPFVDNYEPRLQMKIVRGVWERDTSRTRSRVRGSSSRTTSRSRVRSQSRDGRMRSRDGRPKFPVYGSNGNVNGARRSKSRSRDIKIGKGARKVLRGCICVDVKKRWTIGQIDEVAWNVGWGDGEELTEDVIAETPTSADLSSPDPTKSTFSSAQRTPALTPHNEIDARLMMTEVDARGEAEWTTDHEEDARSVRVYGQLGGRTSILSQSRSRIVGKRSETLA